MYLKGLDLSSVKLADPFIFHEEYVYPISGRFRYGIFFNY